MYYRVAIQGGSSPAWQWMSTALSELSALFQFLRLYRALGHARLRVFSSSSRDEMNEQLRAREPGTGVHLGHSSTIPARADDRFSREGMENVNT